MNKTEHKIVEVVQTVLSPDLLKPYWRKKQEDGGNRLIGHCYVATEACFHLLGGMGGNFKPYILTYKTFPEELKKGETHWFLKNNSNVIIDPTQEQFSTSVPHERGKRQAFLTKHPSKRAKIIMERVKSQLCELDNENKDDNDKLNLFFG